MKDMYEPLELHEVKEQVAKHASFSLEMCIRDRYFVGNYPARSCVSVKELPKQALFELEVIACK